MRYIDLARLGIVLFVVSGVAGCAAFGPLTPAKGGASAATGAAAPHKPVKAEPPVAEESKQMYQQALTALKAARYPEAERLLLAVAGREPALAGPQANLGIVYAHTNRPAKAIESLQQAIRLNSDNAAYYNELGLVYRREGKFDDARRQYAKALDLDPNYAYAHLNMGILYDLYLPDGDKAMQHYQRYRELVPNEAATVTKWIADLQQRGRANGQNKGDKSG